MNELQVAPKDWAGAGWQPDVARCVRGLAAHSFKGGPQAQGSNCRNALQGVGIPLHSLASEVVHAPRSERRATDDVLLLPLVRQSSLVRLENVHDLLPAEAPQ